MSLFRCLRGTRLLDEEVDACGIRGLVEEREGVTQFGRVRHGCERRGLQPAAV